MPPENCASPVTDTEVLPELGATMPPETASEPVDNDDPVFVVVARSSVPSEIFPWHRLRSGLFHAVASH